MAGKYGPSDLKKIGEESRNRLPPASAVQGMFLYEMQRQAEDEKLFDAAMFRLARTETVSDAHTKAMEALEKEVAICTERHGKEQSYSLKGVKALSEGLKARGTGAQMLEDRKAVHQAVGWVMDEVDQESGSSDEKLATVAMVAACHLQDTENRFQAGLTDAKDRIAKLEDLVRMLTLQRTSTSESPKPTMRLPISSADGQTLDLSVPKGSPLVPSKEKKRPSSPAPLAREPHAWTSIAGATEGPTADATVSSQSAKSPVFQAVPKPSANATSIAPEATVSGQSAKSPVFHPVPKASATATSAAHKIARFTIAKPAPSPNETPAIASEGVSTSAHKTAFFTAPEASPAPSAFPNVSPAAAAPAPAAKFTQPAVAPASVNASTVTESRPGSYGWGNQQPPKVVAKPEKVAESSGQFKPTKPAIDQWGGFVGPLVDQKPLPPIPALKSSWQLPSTVPSTRPEQKKEAPQPADWIKSVEKGTPAATSRASSPFATSSDAACTPPHRKKAKFAGPLNQLNESQSKTPKAVGTTFSFLPTLETPAQLPQTSKTAISSAAFNTPVTAPTAAPTTAPITALTTSRTDLVPNEAEARGIRDYDTPKLVLQAMQRPPTKRTFFPTPQPESMEATKPPTQTAQVIKDRISNYVAQPNGTSAVLRENQAIPRNNEASQNAPSSLSNSSTPPNPDLPHQFSAKRSAVKMSSPASPAPAQLAPATSIPITKASATPAKFSMMPGTPAPALTAPSGPAPVEAEEPRIPERTPVAALPKQAPTQSAAPSKLAVPKTSTALAASAHKTAVPAAAATDVSRTTVSRPVLKENASAAENLVKAFNVKAPAFSPVPSMEVPAAARRMMEMMDPASRALFLSNATNNGAK